ncbi:hypothetical protein AgCh_011307 [Apium graveolens]
MTIDLEKSLAMLQEEENDWSSDSEDNLDYLDSKDDDEDDDAIDGASTAYTGRPNAHGGLRSRRASPLEEWEGKFSVGMSNSVTTAIRGSVRDMAIVKTKTTEKADRATVEQAIDPRTRMVLFKMLNRGVFHEMNGCISTGKEANVYHATRSDGQELAIKVYKTSVLVFKDRDRYVQGDYRFRYGYCQHNPRKMVKTWAEKEMRNLMRLKTAGIRCPTPLHLKLHVLVMEFIGKSGWAAPRLKDAALSLDSLHEAYMEGHLYIIDVSQSVDLDHPHSLEFLEEDCIHVSDFFKKHGVAVMTNHELFDFIVDPSITDDSVDSYLEKAQQKVLARGVLSAEDEIADSVIIQQCYIPRRLDDLIHPEEDVRQITKDTGDMYYPNITGLREVHSRDQPSLSEVEDQQQAGDVILELPTDLVDNINSQETESDNETDEIEDNVTDSDEKRSLPENKNPEDTKAARKENKKKVKEEKREARKTKIPKAVKKKRKKLAKAKKTR